MKYYFFIICIFLIVSDAFGQSGTVIPTLLDKDHGFSQTVEEQKLVAECAEAVAEMTTNGYFDRDTGLINYIQSIVDKIKPPELAQFQTPAHILKSSEINAFCLMNGEIAVYYGMLCLIENEAQLAFILAHELAHFIERHSYKDLIEAAKYTKKDFRRRTAQQKLSFFSIAQEREADSLGLEIFKKTGYDLSSASRALDITPREDTAYHISFFLRVLLTGSFENGLPTHPKTDDRVKFISDRIIPNNGYTGSEIYVAKTGYLLQKNLQLTKSKMGLFEYIAYLEEIRNELDVKTNTFYKWLTYEIGVAYQELYCDPIKAGAELANMEKEKEKGRGLYMTTLSHGYKSYELAKDTIEANAEIYFSELENDEEFGWRIRKNRGLICLKKMDIGCAVENFNAYLNSSEPLIDRRYIKSLLSDIEKNKSK